MSHGTTGTNGRLSEFEREQASGMMDVELALPALSWLMHRSASVVEFRDISLLMLEGEMSGVILNGEENCRARRWWLPGERGSLCRELDDVVVLDGDIIGDEECCGVTSAGFC